MINFYARDRIVLFGDSITSQGVFANVQTAVTNYYTALYGANDPRVPQFFNLGVVSDTVALELARISQIHILCPTVVIFQGVQNDCSGATANGAFTTSYTSILTAIRTNWPRVRLLCTNSFALNEQWPSGTGANIYDKAATGIEAKNAIIAPIIAAAGGELIDFRSVYTIREPAANPSNLATGVYLTDMPHPNAAGQAVLSLEALSHISMQPSDFPISRPWLGT